MLLHKDRNITPKKLSFIYQHLSIYRFVMNLLYFGGYTRRFKKIIAMLNPLLDKHVTELCFGDTHIAKWCNENGVKYIGLDINPRFIANAKNKGYDVRLVNLRACTSIPESEVVIMMGSLYHFHDILDELFETIMSSCKRFIISEPIVNLTGRDNVLGRIAQVSANAGHGYEKFRFNNESLRAALEKAAKCRYQINYLIAGKDAIVEIKKSSN